MHTLSLSDTGSIPNSKGPVGSRNHGLKVTLLQR